jgi:DNA-binding transcriptional ArsR family regulator
MGYETTLEMLADPTRRAIVEGLRSGPKSVAQIAARLPVSRPAVSKHLKLMLEAGLLKMTEDGTRNFYEIDLRAIARVRAYLDRFWDESLQRFKEQTEKEKGAGTWPKSES